MKKLTLDLGAVRVDSFEVMPERAERAGSVEGFQRPAAVLDAEPVDDTAGYSCGYPSYGATCITGECATCYPTCAPTCDYFECTTG